MKTAILFPGQGAQTVGMGADLYQTNTCYRESFDACARGAGIDLKAACFDGVGMEDGEVAQPAIFAHSMGLYSVLQKAGVKAQAFAGLSLGEYSALAAIGVMGLEQGANLVRQRGRIMDAAYPIGTAGMLSVIGLELVDVEETIHGVPDTHVANHLSDSQFVVAGFMTDLTALKKEFERKGAKLAVLLNVRGPSHAPLLSAAADAFLAILHKEKLGPIGDCTVYSGALGAPYPANADVADLLSQQMRSRLLWHDCIEHMVASGTTRFVEVGPGNVLTKMLKRRIGQAGSVESVRDNQALAAFLQSKDDSNE